MTYNEVNTMVNEIAKVKPYRIVLKYNRGCYSVIFLYMEYHYNDVLTVEDLKDSEVCNKKLHKMCAIFEKNFKLRVM